MHLISEVLSPSSLGVIEIMFDGPKQAALDAVFQILREGHDLPEVLDAAFLTAVEHCTRWSVFWRIKALSKTWRNPDARYLGILLLGEVIEGSNNRRYERKAKRFLKRRLKRERDPRNREVIEGSLKKLSLASGLPGRLHKRSVAKRVLKEARRSPRFRPGFLQERP